LGGGVEMILLLAGELTDGRLSVVEHPMAPGSLIEPHTHEREDEYSFIVSGTLGMMLGPTEFEATAGMLVTKPRGIKHAAWNATTEPARFLEIISPAGFERFFHEVSDLFSGPTEPPGDELERLALHYGLTFHLDEVTELIDRHGLSAAVRYP
ncbi:MAG: cupin domain-containing protein, partial [Nakamurella sp.]